MTLASGGETRDPFRMQRSCSLLLALTLVSAATPARADQRQYTIGSFDRVRVEGPFDVRLATGQSPGANAEGPAGSLEALEVRVEGTTLIVRPGTGGWGERPTSGQRGATIVRVSTGMVRSAIVIGGGGLRIDGTLRGQRVDLSLTGAGSIAAPGIEADEFNATLLGSGSMALGGHAGRARMLTSGSGTIAAVPLDAGALIVRLDGPGSTEASARFTADLTTTGIGAITVAGHPACTIHRGAGGGPVQCGDGATGD